MLPISKIWQAQPHLAVPATLDGGGSSGCGGGSAVLLYDAASARARLTEALRRCGEVAVGVSGVRAEVCAVEADEDCGCAGRLA